MKHQNEDIRIKKTKCALKGAFAKLISEVPYNKISIIDICEKAEVHRATFYNYYRSKEDLFSCIIEDAKDAFIEKFKSDENKLTTRSEVINYLVDSFIDVVSYTKNYFKKIIKVQNPGVIKYHINRSVYQNFYQILSLYPSSNQVMPKDFIASFYAGALTNIAFWYVGNDNISKEEFVKYVHYYLKDRIADDYC